MVLPSEPACIVRPNHTAPNGTVRFSVSYFTNNTDLEALNEALEYIEMS